MAAAERESAIPPASYETVARYLRNHYRVTADQIEGALNYGETLELLLVSCEGRELTDAAGDRIAWRLGWEWRGR